jgi:hypothetical protein
MDTLTPAQQLDLRDAPLQLTQAAQQLGLDQKDPQRLARLLEWVATPAALKTRSAICRTQSLTEQLAIAVKAAHNAGVI